MDSVEAAQAASLRYVSDERPGINRVKSGTGFTYRLPDGTRVTDTATIERIKQLTKVETMSSPWKRAGITFFYKNDGVSNHSVLYMKRDGSEKEEVLLDPNTFAADGTVGLAFAEESLDGKYLAFGKTQAGSDWRDIYVMEIATKRLLPDVIKWV